MRSNRVEMSPGKKKKNLVKWIGRLITAAALLFLVKTLLTMHVDFSEIGNPWIAVIFAMGLTVLLGGSIFVMAYAWKCILAFLRGRDVPYKSALKVYTETNLAKYLPGNIMQYAGRNLLRSKLGMGQIDVALSSVIEIGALLISGMILAISFSFRSLRAAYESISKKTNPAWILLLAVAVGAACILLAVYLIKKGQVRAIWDRLRSLLSPTFAGLLIKLVLIYAAAILIPGTALLFSFHVLFGIQMTPEILLSVFGAHVISWTVGFVTIGAPGGIGVRESVLLMLLSGTLGEGHVLVAALFLRIISILADVSVFLIVRLHDMISKDKLEEK